jgi:4-oxalocrotonate tautomerase
VPTLQLKVSPPPAPATQATLAAALTRLTAQALGKRAEVTAVIVEGLPSAVWHVGGAVASQATALLEISITEGTCGAEQKAAFIEGAHALLREALGPGGDYAEASYVIVREWPATNWGFGGRTQAARQAAARSA